MTPPSGGEGALVLDKVRRTAESRGEEGRVWLAALPDTLAALEREWRIAIGQLTRNATEAFVAEARTHDGRDVILKCVIAGIDPARQELRILKAANGRGYADLLRADETRNAMLLEKLGPQLHEFALPEDKMTEAICATLQEARMPEPEGPRFTTGAERAREFAGTIARLARAFPAISTPRTIETALAFAAARENAFDPAKSVVVHGDAHEWNTLAAPGSPSGYKLVDPDGAFAERAFDLAIPMREWNAVPEDPLAAGRARCRLLAGLTGVAERDIWEWSLVQCVWNGLLLKEIGHDAGAAIEFAMADAWAAAE